MMTTSWLYSFAVAFSLFFNSMMHATVVSPTVVEGVIISATDQSAQKAREKAIMAAERRGLKILAEQHTPAIDSSILDTIEESKIQESVKALEIMKEKSSKGKYVGTFKVTYKDSVLQKLFKGNAPISTISEAHCLIVPIYKTNTGLYLWGDDNPWFAALHQEDMPSNLILPLGDLSDMKLFSKESPLDFRSLKNLVAHHDSGCAYGALLRKDTKNAYHFKGLKITETSAFATAEIPVPSSSDTSPASLGDAVKLALKIYGDGAFVEDIGIEGHNHDPFPQTEISQKMTLVVSFNTFEEWQQIKTRISSVNGLKNLFVNSLSKTNATLSFHYVISRDAMIEALKNNGFDINSKDNAPFEGKLWSFKHESPSSIKSASLDRREIGVGDIHKNTQKKDSRHANIEAESDFDEDEEEIS
ncbi:MAG: hypothetical protein K2X53_06515 [Alphaproteobacteria bacterium]|nr:hypothetical protein [Alphaproteobacteria bacterium]